jgi:hypothetical protein
LNIGELNKTIAITTLTETVSSGDVTQVDSLVEVIRAKVTQLDGSRYVNADELIDRALYKIECWDNNYSNNIKITYGNLVLYPIRPVTRNRSNGSKLNEIIILAATKVGAFASLTDEEMKYMMTSDLGAGVTTVITTPLTTEPYNVEFIDSAGNIITTGLTVVSLALVGGVYVLSVYNGGALLSGVKVKFIY